MDKRKNTGEWKRHGVQAFWALLTNSYLAGFVQGKIYKGKLKNLCVPGLNCYSCPGAVGACPIGAMQAVIGNATICLLCGRLSDVCGSIDRKICLRLAVSFWADSGDAA